MKTISKGQLIIIIGAVVLVAGIMCMPKTENQDDSKMEQESKSEVVTVEMQIKKGVSTVLNSEAPMQGIMILRGVLEKDPENVKAHFALGVLSVLSKQYDKANNRFQKVIDNKELDQNASKFLAEIYVGEGKQNMIIESLNEYIALSDEKSISIEAQELIKELIKEIKNI